MLLSEKAQNYRNAALSLLAVLIFPLAAQARDYVLVQRHDFEAPFTETADLGPEWSVVKSAGAKVQMEGNGLLGLHTVPDTTAGSVSIAGTRRFSASDLYPLVFTSRLRTYVESSSIYGDRQPRGLAQGHSRSNAIEFVTAYPTMNSVACRTVKNGVVQETVVQIAHSVYQFTTYQIIATASRVDFYIDGKRVARHVTNIPTAPLNLFLSTSDSGAGNVPILIDWIALGRLFD